MTDTDKPEQPKKSENDYYIDAAIQMHDAIMVKLKGMRSDLEGKDAIVDQLIASALFSGGKVLGIKLDFLERGISPTDRRVVKLAETFQVMALARMVSMHPHEFLRDVVSCMRNNEPSDD
jgi:hypothetical protein